MSMRTKCEEPHYALNTMPTALTSAASAHDAPAVTTPQAQPPLAVTRPRQRFPPKFPRIYEGCVTPDKRRVVTYCREVMRINPLHLFFSGFLPPFIGAIASIIIALLFHNDEISNYNWQCGRARLPSLSRIINLPMERIFWQMSFYFHVPLRGVELAVGYYRYGRLRSVACRYPRLYEVSRFFYLTFGILELIFMVALSVIGEREYIFFHVIFFYLYGLCALCFFITNVFCHRNAIYYLNPYGKISFCTKIAVTLQYFVSIPILFGAFFLYWKKCITIMYDVFAVTEYLDVLFSIIYHSCTFFDIRYKVVFSMRKIRTTKIE